MRVKRAAIYCRISQHNENVPKVQDQEAMCRALAAQFGYEVVTVYVDDGISAYTGKDRPGWNELLSDLARGDVDVLLAQSEDRFMRQVMAKESLAMASLAGGVVWHTVNDGQTDPANASDDFMATVRVAVAQHESRRKSERQRQANDLLRAKGKPLPGGERPFGYEADKVRLRQPEADLLRQAYADFLAGKSLSAIRTDWNSRGVLTVRGNRWDIAKVEKLLRRPSNARLIQVRRELLKDDAGQYREGEWERIVSTDDYWAALAKLDDPRRRLGRVREPKWLCSGIATCGACGLPMRGFSRTDETAYRCAVHEGLGEKPAGLRHVSILAAQLDQVVRDAVASALLFAPEDGVPDSDTEVLKGAHQRLTEIRTKRARLLDLMDDDDDVADIRAKRTALKAEADEIERRVTEVRTRNARAALLADVQARLWTGGAVEFAHVSEARREVRAKFDALDLEERRALTRGLMEVVVMPGRGPSRVQVTHKVATTLNEDAA